MKAQVSMSGKFALIIGNTEYTDPGLAPLIAPGRDAADFARVLKDPELCAFEQVDILLNQPSSAAIEAIDEFFDLKKPDDLLVLYFSGHGIRDELGSLYLAFKNTLHSRLRSTAVKSDYIREAMDQSRSKRQVVILDCCNSGAFPQGTKAEVGGVMGMAVAFQGYGRFVLTASDATQFAWEGDKVIGETQNSLFTHFLVKGLEGAADGNADGKISVDELYDYVYEQIARATPNQTPTKSASRQEGEIVLRQITRIEDIRPVDLPEELLSEIENPYPEVRLRAVGQLARLVNGKNLGLARSAREALEGMVSVDDSRRVVQAAAQALAPIRQQAEPAAANAAEQPRLPVEQRAESGVSRAATRIQPANWQAVMTLGWGIGGATAGVIYDAFHEALAGAVGGAIGGLFTAWALRTLDSRSRPASLVWVTLACAGGAAIGWTIGEMLTEAVGMGLGFAIGVSICLAIPLGLGWIRFDWKTAVWIILGWAIGSAIGWSLAKTIMIDRFGFDFAISWALGTGVGWLIGGSVTVWQLLNKLAQKDRDLEARVGSR